MSNPENPKPSKQKIAGDVKSKAEQAARQMQAQGKEQLESEHSRAADAVDKVAEAADATADELARRNETAALSQYVSEIADGIGNLSSSLRQKNTDELIHDASELARNNAGLFLLGSVAIGFALSRIARANRPPAGGESHWEDYYGQQETHSRDTQAEGPDFEASAGAQTSNPTHASTSYLPEEGAGAQKPITPPGSGSRTSPSANRDDTTGDSSP